MEYKIIHGKIEQEIENKINEYVKNGWKLKSFHTASFGVGEGSFIGGGVVMDVYCHALMEKESE